MTGQKSKYWNIKDQKMVAQLVHSLVMSRGPNGWPYSLEFEIRSHALSALVTLPRFVTSPWIVVGKALAKMQAESLSELPAFEQCVNERLSELLADYRKKRGAWWFILPTRLPISLEHDVPRCVRLFGNTFGFMRIESLKSYLGASKAPMEVADRFALEGEHPQTVIAVKGHGFPLEQVWNSLAPAFDALRGIIEWTLHAGTIRLSGVDQFGTVPHPRIAVCLSDCQPTFVLRFGQVADWDVRQDDRKASRSATLLERISRFASAFPDKPEADSVDRIIADQLRLYGQAMEQRYLNGAVIGFWQMAEALTLTKDDRGAGDRVVARLAWLERFLVQNPTGAAVTVLQQIMQKRNAAVHEGLHFQWDHVDLTLVKEFCEAGLVWLIHARKALRTTSNLRRFWEYLPHNDQELADRATVIDIVKRAKADLSPMAPQAPPMMHTDVF